MPISMPDSELRAGKNFEASVYRLSVRSRVTVVTSSGDGVPTYVHYGQGVTTFVPDSVQVAAGILIQASSSFDGDVGSWSVYYEGPGAPDGISFGGDGFRSDVEIEVRLTNLRIYSLATGGLHVIVCDAVAIYANGVLMATFGGLGAQSAGVGPCYVPVLGIPLKVTGAATAGRAHVTSKTYDACSPGDYAEGRDWTTELGHKVSGGWSCTVDGESLESKVSPYPAPCVVAEKTYGDLLEGSALASYAISYWGRTMLVDSVYLQCGRGEPTYLGDFPSYGLDPCTGEDGQGYSDLYRTETRNDPASGSVTLLPDHSPELMRFVLGYAKLVERLSFPETRATTADVTTDVVGGVTSIVGAPVTTQVHPGLGNDFLGEVRDSDDADALDCLDLPAYAPSSGSRAQNRNVTYERYGTQVFADPPPGVPGPPPGCSPFAYYSYTNFPPADPESHSHVVSASFPSYVAPTTGYQTHQDPIVRYLGTWGNPWFSVVSHRQDWTLQGSPAPWDEYWGRIGVQMLRNAALPGLPSTRSDMGDLYRDTPYTPVWDAYTGGMTPVGVSRYAVREAPFPELVQLDARSEPMLSCPDESCTIAVSGGNVVLTPLGSGPIVLDVDLCRFDCFPYLGLLLAKSVRFASRANVASMTAALRSALGGSAPLNGGDPLAVGTDYELPKGQDAGFAATYGSDSGAGFIDDAGTDVAPGGQSAGVMANPETAAGFQAIGARQGSVLRLTIEPSGSGAVTLALPLFKRVQGHPSVFRLDRNKRVMAWPNGPAILWGTLDAYVHDEGFYYPPLPRPLGEPNSLLDALMFERMVFSMEDPGDVAAYDAIANALRDEFEVTLRNCGSADWNSLSILLPKGADETIRFALVDGYADGIPPFACFPWRKRNRGDWKADGPPAMEVWDESGDAHYTVTPGDVALVLKGPDGTVLSSAFAAPAGYRAQKYVLSLTGDEGDDYGLWKGEKKIGEVYPWHGWYEVGVGQRVRGGVANLHTPGGRYWVAYSTDAGIVVKTALLGGPTPDWRTTTNATDGEGDSNPCLTWDPLTSLGHLVFERDGQIYEATSNSSGEKWGEPEVSSLIPGGRIPRLRHTYPSGHRLFVAVVDDGGGGAGKLVGRYRWAGDLDYGDPFDLTIHPDSAVDPGGVLRLAGDAAAPSADYDVYPGRTSDGRWSLTIVRDGDDGPSEWFSVDDGRRWKPAGPA